MKIIFFIFFIMLNTNLSAQIMPEPCSDPNNNGNGCFCSTAGVLCTPDDLDGFKFEMSNVANSGGLLGDLCPELSDGGNPHNVNFFAFVVWCETLTFDVLVSDCEPGTNSSNFNNFGIQMALFADCPELPGSTSWNTVECVTDGSVCFNSAAAVPNLQTFSASGLEIGATYYFMVDGCFRSTCKVAIDVIGTCGNGEITPWDVGLTGPLTVCVGDTETYTAEDAIFGLDGAEEYYYYLDGVPLIDGEELFNIDITWDTPGSYDLCVDVSNLPCVPESDMPAQNCITIFVSGPGNGDITADPVLLCPDEISNISISNNNTDPLLSNYIIIVSPDGTVEQIEEGLATTFTYDKCSEFTAYYYSFLTSENPTIPSVGDVWTIPDCLANCCSLEDVMITFEDNEEPVFTAEPADITLDCADDITPDEPLTWTDNCAGTGTAIPLVVDDYTLCDGGSIVRTWSFTDSCANNVEHIQTIIIDPIPLPIFTTLPGDSIINCDTAQFFVPLILEYTNSAAGACDITGTVTPTSVGTFELCGSSVTYTWEYTDMCNRTITWSQVVTVQEVGAANAFIDPPGPITITCDEWLTFVPETLNYSNDQDGTCEISGFVDAATLDTHEPCGNDITYTWEFTDACGRDIAHTQVVTVESAVKASFVDPPGPIMITCDELQTFAPAVLSYTNGGTGVCLIAGTVDAVGDGTLDKCGSSVTYTWEYTDECMETIVHTQTVTVTPIVTASFVDPPGPIMITCDELQTFAPAVLSYTNGGTGACLIEGTVDPLSDGTLDICGNTVTYTWEFIDECMDMITHTQIITVVPKVPPVFIDPPMDESVDCDAKPDEGEGPILSYTNGETDACETAGDVSPTEEYNVTECGGTIVYNWIFTDDCGNVISESQTITVNPAPQAQFENLPSSSITIECNENTDTGPDLVVTNNESGDCLIESTVTPMKVGDVNNCGGAFEFVWEFTDMCGRTTDFTQTVNVNPALEATFDNIPDDIDIDCSESTDTPDNLSYTNGDIGDCEISGDTQGVRTGTVDYCGGTLVDTWAFIDECGRTITTSRNVNVGQASSAVYVNPPTDVTVGCTGVNSVSTSLNYNNGEAGTCLISGTSVAVVSGSFDNCGGTLIYTWSFVDDCGRAISYSQNITVDPAPDPAFINPPADLAIGCDETYNGAEILNYTNGATGVCQLFGAIVPITTQNDNIITNTWEFELPCSGGFLTHVQTVTLSIVPDITINPATVFLCLGESYDLQDVTVDDANGTNITQTYHSAFPPSAANEIPTVVSPNSDFIYVINATNEYGCEDYELFTVFIEEPPYAGEDQITTVCSDGIPLNLFNFIPPFADQTGSWIDLDGIGANISNPNGATFNSVPPGIYSLYYISYSTTVCENDTMILEIEVIDNVAFEVSSVTCINGNNFYEVYINSNGFLIQSTEGDVMQIIGNDYVITNIPINTSVFISAFESVSGCSATEFIDIPNCDCPDTDPPTGQNVSICINDQPEVLSVTVPGGMTANWYYTQNSNTPFLEGELEFTIQDSTAGVYSYYVETYDPATDCSSNVKLKIDVEINDLPEATDAIVNICDLGGDGSEIISLQSFNGLTNPNPANSFSYFGSMADAESESGALSDALNLNIGSNIVFVRIVNSADCVNFAELDLVLTALPQAMVTAIAPSCIDDEDGVIDIAPVNISGSMMTSLDGITFTTTTQYNGLAPAAYTVYVQDENECLSTYDVIVPVGLEILFATFTSECKDNGTNTDPSDDFYTITLLIENNIGNSGTYNVIFNGATQYSYSYGSNESFVIPVDQGNNIDIVIADTEFLCTENQVFGPLNPCSTNCEVSIDVLDYMCSDGGTDTDPSDDFYTVKINASAMNGSVNNTYNVFLDGTLLYNFDYGIDEFFQVPATGNNLSITCQDNEDVQCQTAEEIGPLFACSGGCQIVLDIVSSICSNNGTATDQTDDFYTYTINGNIINGDALTQFELFVDGVSQGLQNYSEDIVFDIPADDMDHIISISDISNAGCVDAFTTAVLSNCSTDCEVILNEIEEECNDNGTPQDSDDDFYEITINASSINGASNLMYNLIIDGTFLGAYSYDQDNMISLPADGDVHMILIQDSEDLACELQIMTTTLVPCSDGCLIGLNVINVECFNNGTPTDVGDDYYEISISGDVLNGTPSPNFEVLVDNIAQGNSPYGSNYVVTIPADGLAHIIDIADENDSTCSATYTTDALTSCSTDCEISLIDFTFVCSDNGTLNDPSDDFYEVSFSTSSINGSTGYSLTVSGVLENNYSYGEIVNLMFPADGASPILVLTDLVDEQCKSNQVAGPFDPCSNLCTIEPMIMDSECFDNGTPIDPSDDYWEITIFVNPANGETAPTFDLSVDGTLYGTYSYSQNNVITIPADNSNHLITASDSDDPTCQAMVTTEVLSFCSTPCEITATYDNVSCNNNGTNDVSDDDIYFVDLVVSNSSAGQYEIPTYSIGGMYNDVINIGPFNISDGVLTLQIIDADQNLCFIEIELTPPSPCSDCVQTVDAGTGGVLSCEVSEITLAGTSSDSGDYSWYGPAGNLVSQTLEATAVSVGVYTFSAVYSDGCIAEDEVEVTADTDLPIAILISDGDITCNKTIALLDGSESGATSDFIFYWYDGDNNLLSQDQTFETDMAGVYFLQVESIDNNCKSALEPIVVESLTNEPTAIIYAVPDSVIDCVIQTITLFTDEEENVDYTWTLEGSPVMNAIELEISEIGTYGLLAIDSITGCSGEADILISSLVGYPNISLDAPEMLDCDSEEVKIIASSLQSGNNFSSYWQDSDQNIILENEDELLVDQPGQYIYTLIDNDNGCENADSITIELSVTEVEIVTIPEVTYINGQSVVLSTTVNLTTSEIASIQWSPDENMSCATCLTTQINAPTDSIYSITITDINGCQDSAQVRLIRKEKPEVYIPNVFNPNSNSGNNKFVVFGNEEIDRILSMKVFDRWGNGVYISTEQELNNRESGWDGTFNQKPVEQGVYVYLIEVLFVDGTIDTFHGDLTVLR